MLKFFKKILLVFILIFNFCLFSNSLFAACTAEMDNALGLAAEWCEANNIIITRDCASKNTPGGGAFATTFHFSNNTTEWYFACQLIKCNGDYGILETWGSTFPTSCNPADTEIPATPPPAVLATNNTSPNSRCGSIIQTSNQVVGETIPLVGLPFYLTYFSSRVTGRQGEYKVSIPLSSTSISNRITGFTVNVKNEQNNILLSTSLSAIPNQVFNYQWDGKENGIETWGAAKLIFNIKTITNSTPIEDRLLVISLGNFKSKKLGLGGWVPSIWHFYDTSAGKLYTGDGNSRNVTAVKDGIYNRVASADGSEVYYFDSLGRIALTRTGLTGAQIFSFKYDQVSQKLLSITDSFNKITKFTYDLNGNFSQIISAENIKTEFTNDSNGYLKTVKNPKNEIFTMTYKDAGGLLSKFIKPNGVYATFIYDINGNLLSDLNSGGQSSLLSKTENGINAVSTLGRITQNNFNEAANTEVEVRPSGLADLPSKITPTLV